MEKWNFSHKAARFVATGGWSGLSPIMPGTAGSVAAFVLSLAIFGRLESSSHVAVCVGLVVVSSIVGLWTCSYLLRSSRYDSEDHDPQEFVIDEFAGYFVAITGLTESSAHMLVGLICFRIFDILKPPPVSTVEDLPRAWGIMCDDIVAGIYAAILARAIISMW